MSKRYVKPAEGVQVRDPQTGERLPAEGAEVTLSAYWQRRLRDGDVIESKAPKVAKTKTRDKE